MINKLKILALLFIPIFIGCSGQSSKPNATNSSGQAKIEVKQKDAIASQASLPDTTGAVKGYETNKYSISIANNGTYSVKVSSPNTGLIFVIQDSHGDNITDETSRWEGELKKGNYTIIVGLMRNSARNNLNNSVEYQIKAERK